MPKSLPLVLHGLLMAVAALITLGALLISAHTVTLEMSGSPDPVPATTPVPADLSEHGASQP